MKSIGIIAEYNPFHNGHKYQIETAKQKTGAAQAVVLMSGDYMQRGTPAFSDKYLRTEMALNGGADIVFELPLRFSASSAEVFASGAVSILNRLHCIDFLCFGSECGSTRILGEIADILLKEPEAYRNVLKQKLKEGFSFPSARASSLKTYYQDAAEYAGLDDILSGSNNILGIEYMKALKKTNSSIKPMTIQRFGAAYRSGSFLPDSFNSAGTLRAFIENTDWKHPDSQAMLFSKLKADMLPCNLGLVCQNIGKRLPVAIDDFSILFRYVIRNLNIENAKKTMDFSPELFHRLKKNEDAPFLISSMMKQYKTKQYTYTRIQRLLLHLLLDIGPAGNYLPAGDNNPGYLRLLGFQKTAAPLLRQIQDHASLKIITKPADAKKDLDLHDFDLYQKEIHASQLYQDMLCQKFGTEPFNEWKRNVVII